MENAPKEVTKSEYWASRQNTAYYALVKIITSHLALNAKSLIDVGSAGGDYVLGMGDIPDIASLDLRHGNDTPGVRSIVANFLTWEPDKKYDVVTCLQVLEHIDDAGAFAQKLLATGDIVVASVPYKWIAGKTKSHVHDPVDESKMLLWFGREPNYSYICREPKSNVERLIHVYDSTGRRWKCLNDRDRVIRVSEPKKTQEKTTAITAPLSHSTSFSLRSHPTVKKISGQVRNSFRKLRRVFQR